jgi:hypothetical protein
VSQLLKWRPRESGSLLRSVHFDTGGWTSTKRNRDSLEWRDADEDSLCVSVHTKANETPSGLPDLDSLRAFYREEAIKQAGGLVSAEIVRAAGIESVKVIKKYERHPAYAYKGALIIPLKKALYTFTVDSIEGNVTGERDAVVGAALAELGELKIERAAEPGKPRRIKGWFQDPYDPGYQSGAIYSMSDDD